IDPASMDAVLWSLAYRTNPIEDVHLVPHRGGVQGAQYGPKTTDSGMLVDATRKYPMAPLALPTREYMEHARAVGGARPLPAQRPVAVAWLWLGRLDRPLGDVCTPRRYRRLGAHRQRDARAPARRPHARNARPLRRQAEEAIGLAIAAVSRTRASLRPHAG